MRLAIFLLAAFAGSVLGGTKVLPLRWVYVSRGLRRDQDVADIRSIVTTAAAHGLNGMVLSAGLDRLDLQPPDYFKRLEAVKAICRQKGGISPDEPVTLYRFEVKRYK